MGITLDTNIYLLCSLFNINTAKISNEYSGKTIEQIMEAEAKQGNEAAANYDKIISDPIKLIQLIQLNDAGNKYAILNNMNEADLDDMLPFLQQQDMVVGLNFFNQEKLLQMLQAVPKEQLVNYTLQMFSVERLMTLMPNNELNKVLQSTEMKENKNLEMQMLQTVKPEILAQMIEAVTGQEAQGIKTGGASGQQSFDMKAMLQQIQTFSNDEFQQSLLVMPEANKQFYMLNMVKEKPEIMLLFDSQSYTNIIAEKKQKEDMVRYAGVLENDQLVKMTEQLPKELTAIVLTQIDTSKFADVLITKFKDVLSQIVAG